MTSVEKLYEELQALGMDAVVTMFVLRLSKLGGGIEDLYLHPGTNMLSQPVTWQGQQYAPYPADFTGFELSSTGSSPRPTLSLANLSGAITGLAGNYDDLIGIEVERVRTFVKFLDTVNFPGGVNLNADPNAEFPRDRYKIGQKVMENPAVIQFSLRSVLDLDGVMLPARQIIRNVCTWEYRGDGCFYDGPPVADESDNPTNIIATDKCSRHLSGCRLRFGENGQLAFSSFPTLGLL